ncbi:MAG TPA: VOC family protein [Streptosporangiaceae bacterium]|jgi:catechol 2,3-dioxygenase-like lactoylglutathione lyase family enzyme
MTEAAQVTRVRTIGVPVRDQDRALRFYTDVLGCGKSMDVPVRGGARWIEVTPPGGGTTIALTVAKPDAPAGVETGIRLCAPDADAFRQHLLDHGASADEVLRWPGVPPMFAFRDQDGNGLEIVQEA